MADVTSLDAKRDEKKTTLERIKAVFVQEEIEGHAEGVFGIVVYGYKDAEGENYFAVSTGGDARTSQYLGLMQMAAFHLYEEARNQ